MVSIKSRFVYYLFTFDCSYESIIREQYELSKIGISLTESSNMPDFERIAYVNLLIKDKKSEAESLKI